MIREAIAKAVEGKDLEMEEMKTVMEEITSGEATAAQIASLITALRVKGETVTEITAAAEVMRRKATRIETESDALLVDTCGTGGDQSHTFNISTATAFVVAGAGIKVAKHGNRSVSSTCGSADVCEAMGININLSAKQVGAAINTVGMGFLFAPNLHGTMKHAIGPRKEIGIRTIFNLLGPLTNPAAAQVQVLGVYNQSLTTQLAAVLGRLGSRRALVVHGEDGIDEITTTGNTYISEWNGREVSSYTVHPKDFGLPLCRLEDIRGGSAKENAGIIVDLLQGRASAYLDIVLLNAGAALYAAGSATDIAQGIDMARQTILAGKATEKLEALVRLSTREDS